MRKFIFLLTLLLFSFTVLAVDLPPSGEVVKLRGEVVFDGLPLKVGDLITKVGKIETKDKSYLQIKIDKWKNTISIGPNSSMQLNFSDSKKYTLEAGSCRWKSFAPSDSKGKIFTKTVSLGVRGTDFFLKTNTLLDETEVIMFDGQVFMENLKDADNTAFINKGQWGGFGGRFGQKIYVTELPKAVLDTTEKILE